MHCKQHKIVCSIEIQKRLNRFKVQYVSVLTDKWTLFLFWWSTQQTALSCIQSLERVAQIYSHKYLLCGTKSKPKSKKWLLLELIGIISLRDYFHFWCEWLMNKTKNVALRCKLNYLTHCMFWKLAIVFFLLIQFIKLNVRFYWHCWTHFTSEIRISEYIPN